MFPLVQGDTLGGWSVPVLVPPGEHSTALSGVQPLLSATDAADASSCSAHAGANICHPPHSHRGREYRRVLCAVHVVCVVSFTPRP